MQYPHSRRTSETGRSRRFSLLPSSFSFRNFSSGRAETPEEASQIPRTVDPRGQQRPVAGPVQSRTRASTYGTPEMGMVSEGPGEDISSGPGPGNYESHINQQFATLGSQFGHEPQGLYGGVSSEHVQHDAEDQHSGNHYTYQSTPNYYDDYNGTYDSLPRQSMQAGRSARGPGVLQKNNRKFADAYEYERDSSHHSGSSGAARKVMDFFRRRAKSRADDDR